MNPDNVIEEAIDIMEALLEPADEVDWEIAQARAKDFITRNKT